MSEAHCRRALLVFMEPTPYILDLVKALNRQSLFRVEVLFIGENLSQPWHLELGGIDAEKLPVGFWRARSMMSRRLSTHKYAALHLCGWGHPMLVWAMFQAAWRHIPLYVESDTPYDSRAGGWKALIKQCLYPLLFRLPTLMLPGGTRQAAYLRNFGVPEKRIRIVGMTVDVERMVTMASRFRLEMDARSRRAKLGIQAGEVAFIFVGRLEEHKGIAILLEAFAILRARGMTIALIVAGDGLLRETVVQATTRDPAIHWLGRLNGEEVVQAYCAADILVLPSSFEPWGLVVNEAMACGLPTIVSDRVGSADDLVVDKTTGRIVPANSVGELVEAMAWMAADGARLEKMGRAAQLLIKDWTMDNWARNICSAWDTQSNEIARIS